MAPGRTTTAAVEAEEKVERVPAEVTVYTLRLQLQVVWFCSLPQVALQALLKWRGAGEGVGDEVAGASNVANVAMYSAK